METIGNWLSVAANVITILFLVVLVLWLVFRTIVKLLSRALDRQAIQNTTGYILEKRPWLDASVIRATVYRYNRTGEFPPDKDGQDIIETYKAFSQPEDEQ